MQTYANYSFTCYLVREWVLTSWYGRNYYAAAADAIVE